MLGELLADLLFQGFDLVDQGDQGGHQGAGDMGVGAALDAGGPARGGGEPGMQGGRSVRPV